MKVAFFEVDDWEQTYFANALKDQELMFFPHMLEEKNISVLQQVEIISPFIYSRLDKEKLQRMPALKLIITRSTGFDHIDLSYCKHAGIQVCNVPKYGGTAVAEHTLALILALARNLPRAIENTLHDDFSLEGLRGFELAGKTLGIVGIGTIGQSVARTAKALGMNVLAYERTPNKQVAEQLGFTHASFKELLKKSDIVTIHVPLTPETHHLFGKSEFKQMKPTSYLINTARGSIVDTEALARALDEGWIAGAALDVLEGESELHEAHQPLKEHHFFSHDWKSIRRNHTLLKRKNVIITPHMAFDTNEAVETIMATTVSNVRAFQAGTPANRCC